MFEVQDYLKSGKTLEDLELEYGIKCNISSGLGVVSLNYSQIASDMSLPLVQECRALILELNSWNVVCRSYKRFFNFEEPNAAPIRNCFDWTTAKVPIKVDGCCEENTQLFTEDGYKSIKDICDNKYKGRVLSYDIENDLVEFDDIVGYSVQETSDDWYEIELEDNTVLVLTGTHQIWLPELNCYRKIRDLIGEEVVLLER